MLKTYLRTLLFAGVIAAQAPPGPTTHVLATLSVRPGITRDDVMKVMDQELADTIKLHLDGKIVQWYGRSDGKGVVFLVACSSVAEARQILNQLPLIQRNLASFEYLALGPLTPLRLLLKTNASPIPPTATDKPGSQP
jgi:hypothetical protein